MRERNELFARFQNQFTEAGCDEAGRGALAGPVFAAAVILPDGFNHPMLYDSKQLSLKQRNLLRDYIEKTSIWAVASVDAEKIDEINILRASILAMQLAVEKLSVTPGFLIIDGNRFTQYNNIPHKCIVKGDSLYASIAAASILAKTHRDEYMRTIAKEFPQYDWERNMAYPTANHRKAIAQYGASPYHRKSYKLLPDPLLF